MTDAPDDPATAQAFAHATALLLGESGVLIRGASGTGKSALAAWLCAAAAADGLFARLIGDDRVALVERHGRLVARPHPVLAGLHERRMLGLLRVPFESAGVIRLVVDLSDGAVPPRYPEAKDRLTCICAVMLPCLILPPRPDPGVYSLIRAKLAAL